MIYSQASAFCVCACDGCDIKEPCRCKHTYMALSLCKGGFYVFRTGIDQKRKAQEPEPRS